MTDGVDHGTKAFSLTPGAIIAAARADARRVESNREGPPYERYAFHRKHAKTGDASEILKAALADPKMGLESAKRNTRILYSDRELLKRALEQITAA